MTRKVKENEEKRERKERERKKKRERKEKEKEKRGKRKSQICYPYFVSLDGRVHGIRYLDSQAPVVFRISGKNQK
jgi:hypothetical protein